MSQNLWQLTSFGTLVVSVVLMTATCPSGLEQDLFQKLGRKVYKVLRRSTDRPEISQEMIPIRAGQEDFERTVANDITSVVSFSNAAERALLFCNSRDECNRMAKLLGWKSYHSSVSIEDRSEVMQLWKDGSVQGLACTSMLNCCLDYPHVSCVFHLGPPRDIVDYYQAIGRGARAGGIARSIVYFNPASLQKPASISGNDIFGKQVIYDMLHDTSLCRRLRPGFFLDGVSVPCAMLPGAQLCDICTSQLSCQNPDTGLHRVPDYLAPSRRVDIVPPCKTKQQITALPNPLNQPAPLASFATRLAAANSCLAFGKTGSTRDKELGCLIHTASDNLAKSCVNCWSSGLEYHSHPLAECHLSPPGLCGKTWKKWLKDFRLPNGCCFYCGCPQKVCSYCICSCSLPFSCTLRLFTYQILAKSFVFMNILVISIVTGPLCLDHLHCLSFGTQS
jgi:hypothetical protein